MEPVRWGILSTARINRAIVPHLHESPASEVVAVASRSADRAASYAAENGIPRSHGSYEELLADGEVEVVYISLPNGPHVEWSIRALEAGKHVLCEKPFARRPDDVERAFDVAERSDRLLMEALMWRHHPQTARLAELVRTEIGELRLVRTSFSFTLEGANVRLDPELLGGALMDVGCYCVSGIRLLAGEPHTATALQVEGPTGVDMRVTGTLACPNGVLAQFDCGMDLAYRQWLEAVGSDGAVTAQWPWNQREAGLVLRRGTEAEPIAVEWADPYRCQCDNFSRAVRGLEPPLLDRADALGQARAIDALYRSADAGGAPARIP